VDTSPIAVTEEEMPQDRGTKKPRPMDAYVGSRIRLRRNLLGISQTELGDRIGVTFQQVQKYEKGVNRIGTSRLIQICEVLQTMPEWLFEGAPGPKTKPSAAAREMDAALAAFMADDTASRLIMIWPRLPTKLKRLAAGFLAEVAEHAGD
jgi:transcriptional regulator with XRE-family HTH domain